MNRDSGAIHYTKVRDVVRDTLYLFPPDRSIFRVPYDMFRPTGPVRVEGDAVHYQERQDDEVRTGRISKAQLRDAEPGEHVLLQLPSAASVPESEWWLCEVMELDVRVNAPAAPSPD
jgi:hypothetical protein